MIDLIKSSIVEAGKAVCKISAANTTRAILTQKDPDTGAIVFPLPNVAANKQTADTLFTVLPKNLNETLSKFTLPDFRLHAALHKAIPQFDAIVTCHVPAAVNFVATGKEIPVYTRYHAENFPGPVRCTKPLALKDGSGYEKALTDAVLEAVSKCDTGNPGALLIRNFGVCVWDTDATVAVAKIKQLNAIAGQAWQMELDTQGGIQPMDPAEYAALYNARVTRNSFIEKVDGKVPGTKVTAAEEKYINLALLDYFDKVCRENDIKYSLTGGTLLGAVRHKGLIPWDDDVDVFLSRPEFEKLRDAFPDGGRYVYVDRVKEPGYPYVFGRLIDTDTIITKSPNTLSFGKGLFVDVCVVDGLPKSKLARDIHMLRMRILFRCRRATIHSNKSKSYANKGPLVLFAKKVINKLTTAEYWNKKIEKLMQKYPWDSSEYVGNFTSAYGKREMLHRSGFDTYTTLEFEGKEYMVFGGYEEYLTNIYRDYMELPPVRKRVGHHPNTAYWVDRTQQKEETKQ